jgi:hypothetical protein
MAGLFLDCSDMIKDLKDFFKKSYDVQYADISRNDQGTG